MNLPAIYSKENGNLNVIIETPQGSSIKYKFDKENGCFKLHKYMPVGTCFPFDFGFILKKKGVYSSSGGPNPWHVFITPLLRGKKEIFAPPKNLKACLSFIKDLVEKGSFRPVIDRKYSIDKIAEAYQYVATGQKIGNVIITVDA